MKEARHGRRRAALAAGSLLGLGLALTGAAQVNFVDGQATVRADMDFDIMVAGVPGAEVPASFDWREGNPTAHVVAEDQPGSGFGPGAIRHYTVGVLNNSDELAGDVLMSVVDSERETPLDLFDQLIFTVTHDGTVLADGVFGSDPDALSNLSLGALDAGEHTAVHIRIQFCDDAGNDYQRLGTGVTVDMRGVNR